MAGKNQSDKPLKTQILIIGAGIAGTTLALLLADKGMSIDLVDPYPPESPAKTKLTGRTVALMQTSLNVLKAAGLSEFLEQHGTKMKKMRIIDDSISDQPVIESEFEASDIGLEYFSKNIPNCPLRSHAYAAAKKHKNITIHEGESLEDFTVEQGLRVLATLSSGKTIKTPLIIGADGRGSLVRKLSGIKASQKKYGQSAITCIINHSRSHENTSTEFHRPSGPFALVPLQGNQSAVVWVESHERAEELIKLKKQDFTEALQNKTNNILGGITLETNPEMWPLCAIKAKSLTAPRTALIAEAAHVMSPITAQGLNLSLRDVASLAETIIDAYRLGQDYGSETILKSYASRRSLDIQTRFFGVDKMNSIVSNDIKPLKDLRRNALKLVDRVTPIKTFAMKHGLAPTLDTGRLMAGKSL